MFRTTLLAGALTLAILAAPGPGSAAESDGERGPAVGSEAPGFTLESLDGREVALSGLTDEGPVVLVFFRGAW